ncbi:endonuclease/reverse transcriptase [Blumeria hordei DH14]|uniref:Endonuclease/reverse transcriptase n=1 Tax=Blumeria graminis f. sp. hordei (strain DH14) TaxID=546991 RepID=N1JF64_BLUG1|nr:endonuclease/reverse transcriptase [Blumeria hordei DH14]
MEGLNQSQAVEAIPFYNPTLSNRDTPGSSQQLDMEIDPINYDDQIGYDDPVDDPFSEPAPTGLMQDTLTKSVNSLTARAKEAETLFGGISALIDKHSSAPNYATLPAKQAEAFKSLCNGLAKVAARHFDAYLCDKPVTVTNDAAPPRRNAPKTAQTYANAASRASNKQFAGCHTPTLQTPAKARLQPKPTRTNDRLFVRIPEGNTLRGHSAYAIQSHMKAKLGNEGQILTNVQSTKTGFALCLKDGDSENLMEKIKSVSFFGEAPVEKATPWTSYRIKNVPRTYGALEHINEEWKYCLKPVTAEALKDALATAAGAVPVAIAASRNNDANPTSSSTTWIVRFPESYQRLPWTLFLLGCCTQTRILPKRQMAVQCTRCWLWHNTRTYNVSSDLRPKPSGPPKTKNQVTAIRQINADARLRKQAEAGCIKATASPKTTHTTAATPAEIGQTQPVSQRPSAIVMRPLQRRKQNNCSLKIVSANVSRRAQVHELALNKASLASADIVLIQEPYIYSDRARRITKHHPSFETFSPIDDWTSSRPRVMSYVRKNACLCSEQGYTAFSSDMLLLRIISSSAFSILFTLSPSLSKAICLSGDFNLHHTRWQPSWTRSPSPGAEKFTEWADKNSLSLLSPADMATYDRGSVLDLVLGSSRLVQKTKCTLAPHLDTMSDHATILTLVDWKGYTEPLRRLRFDTLEKDLFLRLLSINIDGVSPIPLASTREALDRCAIELTEAIRTAYTGVARRSLGHGKGNPWWDISCKQARQRYKKVRSGPITEEDVARERKEYQGTIARAKKAYFTNKIAAASTDKDIFALTKWHKSTGNFQSTPLEDPRSLYHPPATLLPEKREILLGNLLTNLAEVGDIPLDTPTVANCSISFPPLCQDEVQDLILRAGNTAPGVDEIPTAILRIAWPLIREHIFSLFKSCLTLGHHPADLSSPCSYRPIALLSALGKGLELLIARRIAWIATRNTILTTQQFGALPGRSAVDLTTCLTHDVERALSEGRTASMLTLEVKGAQMLCSQAGLSGVCGSKAGQIQIRLDGELGPLQSINCGLPQGSPASSILFMLYISPLFKLGNVSRRSGYADNVTILETQKSLYNNCISLKKALKEALEWGIKEGITFDPAKVELQHLSRKRADKNLGNTSSVKHSNFSVSEKKSRPYIRWLGVYFDKTLSFEWHVHILANKALVVANSLRSLGNTLSGAPPKLLWQAVTACKLPIAYCGAETWWPGLTRAISPTRTILKLVKGHLSLLQKVVRTSARAILPVYQTTQASALYREAGLSPPEIPLDSKLRQALLRIHRLDPRHLLRRRNIWILSQKRRVSHLSRWALSFPPTEYLDPLVNLPWCDGLDYSWKQGLTTWQTPPRIGHDKGVREGIREGIRKDKFNKSAFKAQEWPGRTRLPHTILGEVRVHWIPSHSGLLGNILADKAAKDALAMPYPSPSPLTIASAKAWVKDISIKAHKEYWAKYVSQSYQDLEIKYPVGCPTELSLPRHHTAHIYAACSGHGDFAAYHNCFNHNPAHNTYSCSKLKSPAHFLNCRLITSSPLKPPRGCSDKWKFFLGTPTGASKLAQ